MDIDFGVHELLLRNSIQIGGLQAVSLGPELDVGEGEVEDVAALADGLLSLGVSLWRGCGALEGLWRSG